MVKPHGTITDIHLNTQIDIPRSAETHNTSTCTQIISMTIKAAVLDAGGCLHSRRLMRIRACSARWLHPPPPPPTHTVREMQAELSKWPELSGAVLASEYDRFLRLF